MDGKRRAETKISPLGQQHLTRELLATSDLIRQTRLAIAQLQEKQQADRGEGWAAERLAILYGLDRALEAHREKVRAVIDGKKSNTSIRSII